MAGYFSLQKERDCLNFFYERMNPGGFILSHNYGNLDSVRKAFNEFFKDKKEIIIESQDSQCMIIKGE